MSVDGSWSAMDYDFQIVERFKSPLIFQIMWLWKVYFPDEVISR